MLWKTFSQTGMWCHPCMHEKLPVSLLGSVSFLLNTAAYNIQLWLLFELEESPGGCLCLFTWTWSAPQCYIHWNNQLISGWYIQLSGISRLTTTQCMCGIWRSPPSDCLSCSNTLVLYPSFKRKRRLWSRLVLFISYFKWVWLVFISLYRTARKAHIIPLRRFLEAILHQDLRNFFSETCFEVRYALCIIVLGNVCSFLQLKIKLYFP